jgi:holo-[acyl-carrier protein] synthase
VRIGIDIVDVEEVGRLAARERFHELVFTADELSHAESYPARRRAEYLAGRLAAKEAVAKVLGTGFVRELWWRDVEVVAAESGEPQVRLHRRAASVARERRLGTPTVSISHKGPWALAVAAAG